MAIRNLVVGGSNKGGIAPSRVVGVSLGKGVGA